ncbi:MAG: hypothetical protein K6C98_02655 [Treponema sp.]|nr:hypothetical protein [Treponema sp.]
MTAEELKKAKPNVNFIKTKVFVEKPDIELLKSSFIPDEDMPEFPKIEKGTRIYPLSITEYPSVLSRMTAMEAGAWAITKCKQENWELELENFQSCLANLEMDF